MADFFSEDILIEVLKRLSVKSLLRCRCVQKSWYHLIQTSHFIALHSNYHKNSSKNKHLLFHSPSKSLFSLRFDNRQCKEYHRLVPEFLQNMPAFSGGHWRSYGASNGIICLSTSNLLYNSDIYLWNPVIGKFKTLPNSPVHLNNRPFRMSLGFGYLPRNDDYKVVKVAFHLNETWFTKVDVYSMKSNSWKSISEDNTIDFSWYKLSSNSMVMNSDVLWLGERPDSKKIIACFNMENEIFREILLPQYPTYEFEFGFIHVVCGKLFLFFCEAYDSDRLDIWVREKCGVIDGVWTKKATLKLKNKWFPVGFRNNGRMVLKKLNKSGFVSLDIKKKQKQKRFVDDSLDLWSSGDVEEYGPHTTFVDPFMETLILLNDK